MKQNEPIIPVTRIENWKKHDINQPPDEIESAFPWTVDITKTNHTGMTLRDWFAGQALATLIALHENRDGGWSESEVAVSAYDVADAMLTARDK